jgi:actin-related protein
MAVKIKKPLSEAKLAFYAKQKEKYAAQREAKENKTEKINDFVNVKVSENLEINEKVVEEKKENKKDYPQAIMLTTKEAFIDDDGNRHEYHSHKLIQDPHSIKVLVDRKAHYVLMDDLPVK